MDGISIVFPHALNPENDRVLELNLKMIKENTTYPYEILYLGNIGRKDLVYKFWNWGIENAKYEYILWTNTDLLHACGWDEPVFKNDNWDWLGFIVAECGAIGVADTMIQKDFGRTAETFKRNEFEAWAKEIKQSKPEIKDGWTWYCPSILRKSWFLGLGGFPEDTPFPHPNDSLFKEHAEAAGCRFKVCNGAFYHFQRANENQGLKPERV